MTMADEDVATRAPESDADIPLEPTDPSKTKSETGTTTTTTTTQTTEIASPIQHDTPAQSGPSMGQHCTTDRPLPPSAAEPKGEIAILNSISCYVSKPKSYPASPCKLLLLLTGGTGLYSINNQLQADAYAARGYIVVMPDQFSDDPAPNVAAIEEEAPRSLLERLKMGAAETAKSFMIDMWLARHTQEKVLPILKAVLSAARDLYADAIASGDGIYGVGYCFGAKYILLLCGNETKGDEEVAPEPQLKAGSIAHGTLITKEDIEGVKRPVSMACVANDSLFPDEVREQGRASLELNAIKHEIRVFDGVPHGFAVLGDYGSAKIKEAQSEAFEMMCSWLDGQ